MKTLILCSLISFPFLPSHEASSTIRCLIGPKSIKSVLKKSTAVFSGEVLETKSGINFLEARFRVERSWKGVEADEVLVITDGSAESPHYRVGEKYLVFAGLREGKFFTGLCSRTQKLEYAQRDLQQLGAGQVRKKKLE